MLFRYDVRMKNILVSAAAILILFTAAVYPEPVQVDDGFIAAGVQFVITPGLYESEDSFFSAVEKQISGICSRETPDLIIFPEYIGVFYQLIGFNDIIAGYDTFGYALRAVLKEYPRYMNMTEVFSKSAVCADYLQRWSELADKYNTAIISGSCFVPDENGELRNRSFVFGSDGSMIYHQDKVFLTEFEKYIIGLTPGAIGESSLFTVSGKKIALTICRDAYSPAWEERNSDAFLWVDIKANGQYFNEEQQRSFQRALPLRMQNTDVDYGMTVCSVGYYLDLFWQGISASIIREGGNIFFSDAAADSTGADTVWLRIPR